MRNQVMGQYGDAAAPMRRAAARGCSAPAVVRAEIVSARTEVNGRSSARWPLASLSLAMLLAALGTSSANVALPILGETFAATFQEVQWVVLAYLLASTALVVSVGRLGDVIGRRRLLLVGLLGFSVASAWCSAVSTLGMLIAARAAQGIGAAIMMALAMALVGELVPKAKTGSAIGLIGTMSAIGTALGPSLGGILLAELGWRAVFLVNVPLGCAGWLLAQCTLPVDRPAPTRRWVGFDWMGTVLLALTLAVYALAVTLGRSDFGLLNAALLLAAAVGGGLFVLVEKRAAAPLLRLGMFRDSVFSSGLVMSAVVATVVMTTLVVGPFYLSRALGLGAAQLGLALAVGPVVAALVGVPAGRLVDRVGAQRMTLVGLAGLAVGSLMLSWVPATFGFVGYIVPIVVLTAGYALFQTANNTAVMASVGGEQRGVVSGWLNVSRNLGLISGASVMGAVFALASATRDVAAAAPETVAAAMRSTFAVATILVGGVLLIAIRRRASVSQPSVKAVTSGRTLKRTW